MSPRRAFRCSLGPFAGGKGSSRQPCRRVSTCTPVEKVKKTSRGGRGRRVFLVMNRSKERGGVRVPAVCVCVRCVQMLYSHIQHQTPLHRQCKIVYITFLYLKGHASVVVGCIIFAVHR